MGRLVFVGEASRSVQEILGDKEGNEDQSVLQAAIEWLDGVLSDGPMEKAELTKFARLEGFSDRTIARAGSEIGVVSERDESKRGRPATWRLKDYAPKITCQGAVAGNQRAQSSDVGALDSGVTRQPKGLADKPVGMPLNGAEDARERLLL